MHGFFAGLRREDRLWIVFSQVKIITMACNSAKWGNKEDKWKQTVSGNSFDDFCYCFSDENAV